MNAQVANLIAEYHAFQNEINIRQSEPELHDIVRFNGNKGKPVHRWFTFKEGFSESLLQWVCKTTQCPLDGITRILDPFCGVGTSLLSAQMQCNGGQLHAFGVEFNPFIRFVAATKVRWPDYDIHKVKEFIDKFLRIRHIGLQEAYEIPALSTLQRPEVFPQSALQELLAYRDRILVELDGYPEQDFFLLGWAATIERVSGLRKDGRALRFKPSNANAPKVADALQDQWALMLSDLQELSREGSRPRTVCNIFGGDGRTLDSPEMRDQSFDLILYSPPYLNNIDYSEVYKLELWLMGYVTNNEDFRRLRLGTVRSHPSVKFSPTNLIDKLPENSTPIRLRNALLEALPKNEDYFWRNSLVKGYMDDMYKALSAQHRVARHNAPVVCVVGNSLHGRQELSFPVATDLIIAALAEAVGFTVEELQIARQLRRRDSANGLLRESIIILRK